MTDLINDQVEAQEELEAETLLSAELFVQDGEALGEPVEEDERVEDEA